MSRAEHGEITFEQRRVRRYEEPRLFDLIRIGLKAPAPARSQPENWTMDETAWELIARPARPALRRVFENAITREPLLFGTPEDRIPVRNLETAAADRSLTMVEPTEATWITDEYSSGKKARVRFRTGSTWYNLGITNPAVESRLTRLPLGEHTAAELGISDGPLFFTVSLGEAYHGNCYKLVAAILQFPRSWWNVRFPG